MKESDFQAIRKWRRRGFYSENVLVKLLQKNEYKAVRVPVSNPSMNPLPDIIARRGSDVYAFEVKNASYYAYFPKRQSQKLFEFLNQFIPVQDIYKHPILAAHLGKKWIFQELSWQIWRKSELPEQERITKRDSGNFKIERQ
jgi:Holliday junction resolvase